MGHEPIVKALERRETGGAILVAVDFDFFHKTGFSCASTRCSRTKAFFCHCIWLNRPESLLLAIVASLGRDTHYFACQLFFFARVLMIMQSKWCPSDDPESTGFFDSARATIHVHCHLDRYQKLCKLLTRRAEVASY